MFHHRHTIRYFLKLVVCMVFHHLHNFTTVGAEAEAGAGAGAEARVRQRKGAELTHNPFTGEIIVAYQCIRCLDWYILNLEAPI